MNLLMPLSTFALIFLLICCILSDAYSSKSLIKKHSEMNTLNKFEHSGANQIEIRMKISIT